MTEFAAIMGLSQLRCLDGFVAARNRIAGVYDHCIHAYNRPEKIRAVAPSINAVHAYWRYLVCLGSDIDRIQLKKRLGDEGIAIDWAYFPPLHLQPAFRHMYGNCPGMLPESELLLQRHICLPMHAQLTENDARFIIARTLDNIDALGTD